VRFFGLVFFSWTSSTWCPGLVFWINFLSSNFTSILNCLAELAGSDTLLKKHVRETRQQCVNFINGGGITRNLHLAARHFRLWLINVTHPLQEYMVPLGALSVYAQSQDNSLKINAFESLAEPYHGLICGKTKGG
jgi:hypothetical protein